MSVTWATKYGMRRVRHEPPTLEEALTAAEGIAMDREQQVEIAAELMQVPVEHMKVEAARIFKDRGRKLRLEITPNRRAGKTVVVERKAPRRILGDARRSSSGY